MIWILGSVCLLLLLLCLYLIHNYLRLYASNTEAQILLEHSNECMCSVMTFGVTELTREAIKTNIRTTRSYLEDNDSP